MTTSFCLFDTEYTTWPDAMANRWNKPGQYRELTQIAAAIVTPGGAWEDFPKFNILVKPVLNPELSAYATELTGITQAQIDNEGWDTEQALAEFACFANGLPCLSNGMDIHILAETCGLQQVVMPFDARQFNSLAGPLYDALRARFTFEKGDYPSGKVHQLPGIELAPGLGQVHDALRDVWSLFVTMDWLEREGAGVWGKVVEQEG